MAMLVDILDRDIFFLKFFTKLTFGRSKGERRSNIKYARTLNSLLHENTQMLLRLEVKIKFFYTFNYFHI